MSPQPKVKDKTMTEEKLLDPENEKFKITLVPDSQVLASHDSSTNPTNPEQGLKTLDLSKTANILSNNPSHANSAATNQQQINSPYNQTQPNS